MTVVEGTRQVRDEDAFDVRAVAEWLRDNAAGEPGLVGVPDVRQFAGGASNLTYLMRYPSRDLILRRPPRGRRTGRAHDVAREYRIQARLEPVFPYVPAMVALCEDETVLGAPFYVMERVPGTILRRDPPPGFGTHPDALRGLARTVLDRLVDLHTIDPAAAALSDLGRGEGYVARQVDGWSQRYRRARTWNVGSFEPVMAWLAENQPSDSGSRLVHNDFRFDNVVLSADDPPHVRAVLDWELATVGDPLMDLGGALAYWVQADDDPVFKRFRRQPTHLAGMPTRHEVVEYYATRTGIELPPDRWLFYEVFGLFRLAVIAQQLYHRYHHRQTRNPAFRHLNVAALYLEWRCRRLLRRGR